MMGIDDRYRAEEDEAQLEYIRQWRAQAVQGRTAQGLSH